MGEKVINIVCPGCNLKMKIKRNEANNEIIVEGVKNDDEEIAEPNEEPNGTGTGTGTAEPVTESSGHSTRKSGWTII